MPFWYFTFRKMDQTSGGRNKMASILISKNLALYFFTSLICFIYFRNGKCENTVGSFKCLCDDGYSLKGDLEDGCTDDDECLLDLYHCDPMAECKNTNGTYECICREGFTGDGFDCHVIV